MVLGCVVITFSGFKFAGVALHPHTILRKVGATDHFGGKFGSGGAASSSSSADLKFDL